MCNTTPSPPIFGRDFGRVSLKIDRKCEILAIFSILPYTDGLLNEFLIFSPKNGFSSQKVQKYWKSKNGVKTALTPLFKELWAIYVCFTNLKFDDYQKHQRKPAKVQKSWRIEFQPRKGSKMWKFLRSISGAEISLK